MVSAKTTGRAGRATTSRTESSSRPSGAAASSTIRITRASIGSSTNASAVASSARSPTTSVDFPARRGPATKTPRSGTPPDFRQATPSGFHRVTTSTVSAGSCCVVTRRGRRSSAARPEGSAAGRRRLPGAGGPSVNARVAHAHKSAHRTASSALRGGSAMQSPRWSRAAIVCVMCVCP